MTESEELKWHFPSTDNGEEDGANDSLLNYFAGDHEHSVAREAIQNSIDARKEYDSPVIIEFERLEMKTTELPGHDYLLKALHKAWELTKGQERAEKLYRHATDVLSADKINVLRVGDYNTHGLTGADNDRNGGWYSLVRAKGASAPKGAEGGSFGIGKGAPFVASAIRTVYYSTLTGDGKVAFQGKARISSFEETPGDVRRGVGDFGQALEKGVGSVRNASLIPKAFLRDKQGTDIFILGYETAESDWRTRIIHSVLNNFWAAIHFGELEVAIKDGNELERITAKNLEEYLQKYYLNPLDALHFYEAVVNPEYQKTTKLDILGEVSIFIKTGENFPKGVQLMRSPLMVVQTETGYRGLPAPYAAVFICRNQKGNRLLKNMEPPAHDEWKESLYEENGGDSEYTGKQVWGAMNRFVRKQLSDFFKTPGTETHQIKGLNKYLGVSIERDDLEVGATHGVHTEHLPSESETAVEVTVPRETTKEVTMPTAKPEMVTVSGAQRGSDTSRGGVVSRRNDTHDDGASSTEEGNFPRMDMSAVNFEAFTKKAADGYVYTVMLSPAQDVSGSVRLLAMGDGANYPVAIKAAALETGEPIKVSGSMLTGIKLTAGQPIKLNVSLAGGKRYTLGVDQNGR